MREIDFELHYKYEDYYSKITKMRGYIAHLPDIRNLLRLEGPAQITSWSFISATDCGTLLSPYRPLPLKSGNIENWHFSHSPAGINKDS